MNGFALSNNEWLANEFASAKFSDFRLTRRFFKVMEEIIVGEKDRTNPSKLKGRHRFFKNNNVDLANIFDPHVESTKRRLPDSGYLLNIQDTSGLNYHFHNSKTDLGHIGSSTKRPDAYGYWLHTGLLCDSSGVPLGISYQQMWSRLEWDSVTKTERKSKARRKPIEEKESYRWLEGIEACSPYRSDNRTIVHVCDRESDIFEFFNRAIECGDKFLVRAKSNRAIVDLENDENTLLFEAVNSQKIKANTTVKIMGNSERASKEISLGIRWCPVEIKVPQSNRTAANAANLNSVKAWVVKASSKSKIDGKPIEWTIITNIPIETEHEAVRAIGWYALRWRIELFFKTLKSGAKIEGCRLTDIDRVSKYGLMLSLKAFRVMQLTFYARENPDVPATQLFSDYEWRVIKKILFNGQGRPNQKAAKIVEMIAEYGGFQRGKNRSPGTMTVWEGWTRISTIISGAKSLGFK